MTQTFDRLGLVAIALLFACAPIAHADDFPTRPIRIIVPTGPGGAYDVVGRLVGDQLSRRFEKAVVVENKTGAGTIVGTQYAIGAAPDGYTLLVGGLSNIVFNASLHKKAPYDGLKQLVPVAIVYRLAYMFVGSKDLPYSNVQEVIAAAKTKPGAINMGTAGVGTGQQLAAVAFMKQTGTKFLEVPYKSASAVYTDLLAGRVDLFFDSITASLPYVQAGKVKALAYLAPKRTHDAPDVPTLAEQGVPGVDVDSWIGIFAPAGTPASVIETLQKGIAISAPDLRVKFEAGGAEYVDVPPSTLQAFVNSEYDKWDALIKEAGIQLE